MATTTTTVAGKIELDGSSIGGVRKQLKEATADLIKMQEQFGATSKEALEAAKRVATLRDRIKDASETADLFDPGKKMAALGNAVQGVAQGFTAVQGAMGLFGVESKEVEKQLLRVQSAMALSQGLSGVLDAGKHFTRLGSIIKTQVVTAFTTLRGAIIATGFGALAVAVGLVVANFDAVKQAVLNLFPGLEKLGKFIGKLIQGFTDFIGVTSDATRELSAMEAQQKKNQQATQDQIKLLQAQGGKEKEVYQLSKKLKQDELKLLDQTLKTKGKLTEEELKQKHDLLLDLQILDINEDKRIKDVNDKRLEKQKQHNEKLTAEQKKRNEERLADRKKSEDSVQQMLDNYAKQEEDRAADTAVKKAILEKQRAKATLIAAGANAAALLKSEQYWNKLIEEEREKERQKALANLIKHGDAIASQLQAQADKAMVAARKAFIGEKFLTDEQLKLEQTKLAHKMMATDAVIGLLNAETAAGRAALVIKQVLAAKELILQIKNTIAFSKLEVAKSQVAVAAGVAQTAKVGFPQNVPLLIAYAAQAVGIISAIKSAVKGTQAAGVGSISVNSPNIGNAPLSPSVPIGTQLQLQNQQAINQQGNQASRAYILNSDLQNNEQINAYLQRNASIG